MHPLDEYYIDTYALSEPSSRAADAPTIWCPMCANKLVIAYRRVGRRRYFKHAESGADSLCPLTTPSYQPEHNWIGHAFDSVAGPKQRARFLRFWQRHFQVMRHEAPGMSLRRLTELIAHADVVNLWSYPGLDEHDLPYALLVLAGFIVYPDPKVSGMRVRFWFGDAIRDIGAIWTGHASQSENPRTPQTIAPRLFRVVYRAPTRTPLPVAADIVEWEEVNRIRRVADHALPRVPRSDQRAFGRFLEADREKCMEQARPEAVNVEK